jgi:hypothetical protein
MIPTRLSRNTGLALAVISLILSASADAALVHRWSFNDGSDVVGGANASLVGGASFTGGQLELPGGAPRTNYASAPGITATLQASTSITVESWFTLDSLQNWSKIWMFGTAGGQPGLSYIDYTPRTGNAGNLPKIDFDTTTGNELNTGSDAGSLVAAGVQMYVATVYDSTNNLMSFYTNGVLTDSAPMGGGNITMLGATAQNFFGAAVNFGDPDIDGRINEIRIWNSAMSPAEITAHNALGPDVVPEPSVSLMGLLAGCAALFRRRRN